MDAVAAAYDASVLHPDAAPAVPAMLSYYAAALPRATLPLPLGGFSAMAHVRALTTSHALLLAGDKGYNAPEDLAGLRDPHVALHGSFSLMVNLHAARLLALAWGGFSLHTQYLDGFKCAALLLRAPPAAAGGPAPPPPPPSPPTPASLAAADAELLPRWATAALPGLCGAWAEAMEGFGPDAFAALQRRLTEEVKRPTLKTALAALRLACWDPDVFVNVRQAVIDGAPGAGERQAADIYRDVRRVYERYYPLQPAKDVAFDCARVCMGLRRYPEAINLFLASTRQCGEHHVTAHNGGICLFHLGRFEAARDCFKRALTLAPKYADAASWLKRAEEQLAARAAAAAAAAVVAAAVTGAGPAGGGAGGAAAVAEAPQLEGAALETSLLLDTSREEEGAVV